jgi:hypothetical protein
MCLKDLKGFVSLSGWCFPDVLGAFLRHLEQTTSPAKPISMS